MSSNDNYEKKYLKYKNKYIELKNMIGGVEKYVVGMRVKRVKGDDDVYVDGSIHRAEALDKYGIIKKIQEESEWPPGSGKMLPKTYSIDFENHYEGTKYEGVLINVIEDDLELASPKPIPTTDKLKKMEGIAKPEKEIEVLVDGRIMLLPLHKIGEPILMFAKQVAAYKLKPKEGKLLHANEHTIMVSDLPGFKDYTFKVFFDSKDSTYKVTRLS